MKRLITLIFIGSLLIPSQSFGQYPPFTKWYQNPLGFNPVNLHTSSGIILPAVAATAVLLLSRNDKTLSNRFSCYDDLGVSYGYYGSRTTVYQNNIGLLYRARKFMALGAEFSTVYVNDDKNNTWGAGLRPFVRFYPLHREHFKLFFQSGAGLILFADTYPKPSGFFGDNREGTRLNGSPKYGIGAEFKLGRHITGQAGLWHIHFSNGDNPGDNRNPGHDSNGFSIGLMYTANRDHSGNNLKKE